MGSEKICENLREKYYSPLIVQMKAEKGSDKICENLRERIGPQITLISADGRRRKKTCENLQGTFRFLIAKSQQLKANS